MTTVLSKQFLIFIKEHPGFIGHIFGDGFLELYVGTKVTSVRLVVTQQKEKYEYLKTVLKEAKEHYYGFSNLKIYEARTTNQHQLTSLRSRRLEHIEFYHLFYKNKIKMIPPECIDLPFTDRDLAYWYAEDGSYSWSNHKGCIFCSEGFTKQDCEILKNILKKNYIWGKYAYLARHNNTGYRIVIPDKYKNQIFDTISPYLSTCECFSIKIPTLTAKQPQIFNIISGGQLAYFTEPEQQQFIGIIQALVIGGCSCTWKDDLTEVFLRLQVLNSKMNSYPTFQECLSTNGATQGISNEYVQFNLRSSNQANLISIINSTIKPRVKPRELETRQNQGFLKNPWFWKTLYWYKGMNLNSQRAGLIIGLNHLSIKTVELLVNDLNFIYSLEASLRYRNIKTKTKASIYIPVHKREAFYAIFNNYN
jgi:hypothetical protein